MQKRVGDLEGRLETSNDRLMELAKASKERFDRLQTAITHLDMGFKKNSQDLRMEIAKITGMVTQKKVAENKIQDLMSQYNTMISQYESRIQEIRRVLSHQDIRLLELDARLKSVTPKKQP